MLIAESDLQRIREENPAKKIIFTMGSFDLLHIGHFHHLKWSKEQGDILVVAVNSDKEVRFRKGPTRPRENEKDRTTLVSALRLVDHALIAEWRSGKIEDIDYRIAHKLRPDVIVLGYGNKYELPQWLKVFPDVPILFAPKYRVKSTSQIIDNLVSDHSENRTK